MAVGVFGLQVAYKLTRTELLSLNNTHGWFGGGLVPATSTTVSAVERIDFSNDTRTASTKGPLSIARRTPAATGNSNYGWFGGGWFSPSTPQINYTTVDRVDFSNDSSTASVRGPLASTRYNIAATGNSNYGWFGGGQLFDPAIPPSKSSVDRIDFSNDSATASERGPLTLARTRLAAAGNSNYGWFGGGYNPGGISRSTVDRIDFSNDSATATARGPLSVQRSRLEATGNSNYGWYCGGFPAPKSSVDRIDFANDSSTALVRGPLSGSRAEGGGTGNSNYGWIGGASSSLVDRIDFSNDLSISTLRGPTTLTRYDARATSGQAKSSSIRLQKAGNFGWFGGGINQAPFPVVWVSRVDRIDFSNDSATASVRGALSSVRGELAATGNSNYGWFGGGTTPTPTSLSTVDCIDFSNDSATASARGPLTLARSNLTATGNSNFGWFGGGFAPSVPGAVSRVDRIDFSNDSSTASVRGPLTVSANLISATGNSNYGWFAGGNFSTVNRIDFFNDSPTVIVRGPLTSTRYSMGATGNSNYGWFGGGAFPYTAAVERINFSNDSVAASPRGSLTLARRFVTATGNSNYGWWGSGQAGGAPFSTVDRINFSNDSVTASPRGPLSLGRPYLSATSNTPVG